MLQGAFHHDADDLHIAVGVGAETLSRLHAVVVDHTEAPKAHVLGVVIMAERKTVAARQPAEICFAALGGGADTDCVVVIVLSSAF